MGIAAYNRGTRLVFQQIDAALPSLNERLLYDLNSGPKGPAKILQPTIVRLDSRGHWWLMNRPDAGWAEHGRVYDSLRAIAREFALVFVGIGRDAHSDFITVEPATDSR